MNLIKALFKNATPTTTDIVAQIDKAQSDYDAAIAARANLLAGLSSFTDAEHQKAEARSEEYRRAADRAAARVADLKAMHSDAAAAEAVAVAERLAKDDALRSRASASRMENIKEATELLRKYDVLAAEIGNINARLAEIDATREAINKDLRSNPVSDTIQSYESCHRKHPDRKATVRREKALCWVYRFPASPRDTADTSYVQVDAREEVRRATIGADGKPEPMLPEIYNQFGSNLLITPILEEREVEVARTTFRAGRSEGRLSGIVLPPGFAGGVRHWPREH